MQRIELRARLNPNGGERTWFACGAATKITAPSSGTLHAPRTWTSLKKISSDGENTLSTASYSQLAAEAVEGCGAMIESHLKRARLFFQDNVYDGLRNELAAGT